MANEKFSVQTISYNVDDKPCHWSKGLVMLIKKDGVSMRLDSEELKQLMKAMPRTFGGTY
jgi:hypothetical protein